MILALLLTGLVAGAVFFAVAVLWASHLRFRRLLLEAKQAAEKEGVDAAGAEMLLLSLPRNAGGAISLLLLDAESGGGLHGEVAKVRRRLRADDSVIPLRGGRLLVALRTGAENLPAVARRLEGSVSTEEGGRLRACPVEGVWEVEEETPSEPSFRGPVPPPSPPPPGVLDPLTGTLAEHHTPRAFSRFLASHRRRNIPIAVLRVDVDGLGAINRHQGRDLGDAVLRHVASILLAECRESDLVGRVGSDEFLLCLPGPWAPCLEAARRLAASIRNQPLPLAGGLCITVSIGVAGAPDHGQSPSALFQAAGMALDASRASGRGHCLSWDKSMHPTAQQTLPAISTTPDPF